MCAESFESQSEYVPFPQYAIRSHSEAVKELTAPCGRFKPVHTIEDTLGMLVSKYLRRLDPLSESEVFIGDGLPLNWQSLVHFLHERKIIETPRFAFMPQANDRPKLFNARLDLQQSEALTDGNLTADRGFGAAFSLDDTLGKAVGEALERYFLSKYKREKLTESTYNDLQKRKKVLPIEHLNTFLPWQSQYLPASIAKSDSRILWVPGTKYGTREKVMLPAQLVYWNYKHGVEPMLGRITTSGCAGHFTYEEAVLSGLLELVQRDSFFIYWLNTLSPKIIDVSTLGDTEVNTLIASLEKYRLRATFVNTTSDLGIPTVVCVMLDTANADAPVLSIGSSAGFDPKNLIIHSLIEALLINDFAYRKGTTVLPESYKPFTDHQITRQQRLTAWKGKKMFERFSFFLNGETQSMQEVMKSAPNLKSANEQLEWTVSTLRNLGEGYDVYVHAISDDTLDALGYHVVRVIVPQLFPLYLGENFAPLNSRRLKEAPKRMGYFPAEKMNPWPHPFP